MNPTEYGCFAYRIVSCLSSAHEPRPLFSFSVAHACVRAKEGASSEAGRRIS